MPWTYSGDPQNSDRDAVRFLIGDTDSTDPQLQDEEIDYLLETYGDVRTAAVRACKALAARYSRAADKAIGDLSIATGQLAQAYLELAKALEAGGPAPRPFVGGTKRPLIFHRDM